MNAVVRLEDGGLARGTEAGDAVRIGNDMAPLYTLHTTGDSVLPLALVNARLAVGTDGGTVAIIDMNHPMAAPCCLSLGDVLVHALLDVDGGLGDQAVSLGGRLEGNLPWRHRYGTVCPLAKLSRLEVGTVAPAPR